MRTNDLQQEIERHTRHGHGKRPPAQSEKEHHALADARWVLDSLHWLEAQAP
jgi:hypothetical protein